MTDLTKIRWLQKFFSMHLLSLWPLFFPISLFQFFWNRILFSFGSKVKNLTIARCIVFLLVLFLRVVVLRRYPIHPRVDPTLCLISSDVTFSLSLVSSDWSHQNTTDFGFSFVVELLRCFVEVSFLVVLATHWEFYQESFQGLLICALMEISIVHPEYLYPLKSQLNSTDCGFVQQSHYLSMHL